MNAIEGTNEVYLCMAKYIEVSNMCVHILEMRAYKYMSCTYVCIAIYILTGLKFVTKKLQINLIQIFLVNVCLLGIGEYYYTRKILFSYSKHNIHK